MWRLCAKHSAAGSSGLRCGARGGSQEVQNTQRRHSQACRATRWRFLYISYISKADPWAIHVCCLLTCRDETSPPCRRVTVSSRHHCGPPLSLVLSILYFLVTFHLLLTNKQCPFFTLPINLPFMLSILYLQFRFPVGTVLVYFLSCFHSLLKACSVIYHIWNKYNKK
jgi:hypothetical protein